MNKIYLVSEMDEWKQKLFKELYGEEVYGVMKSNGQLVYTDPKKPKHVSARVWYQYIGKEVIE